MAEDAIDNKRAYDPTRQDQSTPRKMGRRDALAVMGALGAGAIIGSRFISSAENAPSTEKTSLEFLLEKGVIPAEILLGDVKITKSSPSGIMLNVRSAPTTNDSGITSWLNIEKWNGVGIKDTDSFVIKNALLVEGEFVDNPAGTKGTKGLWIVGNVQTITIGVKNEDPKYISLSATTAGLVSRIGGKTQKIGSFDKSGIISADGQKIPATEIGVVSIPPQPAR